MIVKVLSMYTLAYVMEKPSLLQFPAAILLPYFFRYLVHASESGATHRRNVSDGSASGCH